MAHLIVMARTKIERYRVENAWNEVVQAHVLIEDPLAESPAVCVERSAAVDPLYAGEEAVRLMVAAIATRKGATAIK